MKAAIIHFAPLELYPPIQNLLRTIEKNEGNPKVFVYTTYTTVKTLPSFEIHSQNIKIVRLGRSGTKLSTIRRYVTYLYFYSITFLLLIWQRPSRVFYFETISALSAYLYKKFFSRMCDILIHYHEYTSPEEYRKGMKLVNYFHRLEKQLYKHAIWVSHTNTYRMNMFKKDIAPFKIEHPHILPNYPPLAWASNASPVANGPVKIVYVGALSTSSMYIREFASWVVARQGKVTWDIYSYNCTDEAKTYIHKLNSSFIRLFPGVDYNALPSILKNYQVGVILYTGHIPNYIYNAPNKLFEYKACGLDVWFPHVMTGCLDLVTSGTYPKIVAVDLTNMNAFDLDDAMSREGCHYRENKFFCEFVLPAVMQKLLN